MSDTGGKERCGGVVSYDEDGNMLERFACEVHLFDGNSPCAWQKAVYEERSARRKATP